MKPRLSFRITLLVLFAVLTSGLSGTVLYLNYQRNTESTIRAAESLLEQVASRVFAASGQIIEPLIALADTIARLPGIEATPAAGRTDKLIAAILIRTLDRYPQMTSGYLANGAGEFYRIAALTGAHEAARIALGAPQGSAYAVQSIVAGRDGHREERWFFIDNGKTVLATRARSGPASSSAALSTTALWRGMSRLRASYFLAAIMSFATFCGTAS